MAANPILVKSRGISDDDVVMINTLHAHLEMFIDETKAGDDYEARLAHVRSIEFQLQDLWGFTRDSAYHTWVNKLSDRFRELKYVGRTYRCKETGLERTVEYTDLKIASYGYLFVVGKGFIDFGGYNVRVCGDLEIVS